jgi:hypothetical protein
MKTRNKKKVFIVSVTLIITVVCTSFLLIQFEYLRIYSRINLDGDLRSNISPERRDQIWFGWLYPNSSTCNFRVGYDFTAYNSPFAKCEVSFINTLVDNRPLPFMTLAKGAIRKLFISNITGELKVSFDINLHNFTMNNDWLRTGVVLCFTDGNYHFYFERDIKDTNWVRSAMPYMNPNNDPNGVWMDIIADVSLNVWTHFDIQFKSFITSCGMWKSNLWLDSVYIVNECDGSGYIKYDIKNFWVTIT